MTYDLVRDHLGALLRRGVGITVADIPEAPHHHLKLISLYRQLLRLLGECAELRLLIWRQAGIIRLEAVENDIVIFFARGCSFHPLEYKTSPRPSRAIELASRYIAD